MKQKSLMDFYMSNVYPSIGRNIEQFLYRRKRKANKMWLYQQLVTLTKAEHVRSKEPLKVTETRKKPSENGSRHIYGA